MKLSVEQDLKIRFSDTDAMGVVWHGNYIKYFEDGREAFGEKYDLKYLDIFVQGFFTPIVAFEVKHTWPLYFGDQVKLITHFILQESAKMVFEYEIINKTSGVVCALGKSTQVFIHTESRQLELNSPAFFQKWKTNQSLK